MSHTASSPSTLISADRSAILARFHEIRAQSETLAAPLAPEDQVVQSMPDVSPTKWHLAHITWFFEQFLLGGLAGEEPYDPRFAYLFNSYYETVGPRRPRPMRGLVTRPALSEVRAYRRYVDQAMSDLLSGPAGDRPEVADLLELGLAHEQQHQELILMDVLHLFAQMPSRPAYRAISKTPAADPGPMNFVEFEGGLAWTGHDGAAFAGALRMPARRWIVAIR